MRLITTEGGLIRYYGLGDLARSVGCSHAAIWRRIKEHRTLSPPPHKLGDRLYWTQSEFDAIVKVERQRRKLSPYTRKVLA